MRAAILLSFLLLAAPCVVSQTCVDEDSVVKPAFTADQRAKLVDDVKQAALKYAADRTADNMIWVGRRTAYLGEYHAAIDVFTEGIERFPSDPRFLRHRGHRYITIRCFDKAIEDLSKAATMIKGKADEVEPDGMPNAKNIPTSTLQSNIWYHLGLAFYLKGDFASALRAYAEAEKVSKNPDMLVATKHWQYMTLRRLGRREEARTAVKSVPADLEIIENGDYYALVKIYKGLEGGERLLDEFEKRSDDLTSASIGYGLGNRFLYHNKPDEALKLFRKVVSGKQWASFGFIAAEAELKRLAGA